MKNIQKYEFFYYYKEQGKKYIVKTKECILPKKTNVYKELLMNFNCGFIHSFGYQIT